ncbi:MAG TPA: hypothetical protein VNA17_09215, partial [Pyrinomonadaceae bacterium]|nr:hypothetical protein [Pyrinomonadaceae bacterium]
SRPLELSRGHRRSRYRAREEEMIHFLYLVGFAFFVSVAFAVFASGTNRERILFGLKNFAQFVLVSLVLAWLLYFVPW